MTTSSNRAALAFAAAVSFILFALPLSQASAMGRSGAPTRTASDATERLGQVENGQKAMDARLQAEVDALREQLADLKARMAVAQASAPE